MMNFIKEKNNPTVDYDQQRQKVLDKLSILLREKRISKKLDLNFISGKIHITMNMLKAMEEADLSKLPEPVFTKALLTKYVNFLSLENKQLIDEFPIEKNPSSSSSHRKNSIGLRPLRINFNSKYLYVFYALLLFLSMRTLNNVFEPASFVIDNSTNTEEFTEELETHEIKDNPVPSNEIPVAENVVITPAPPQELNVKLVAQDDSWVRIVIDGETEFEGILSKGSEKEWVAKTELTIRTGNAGGLLISVNEDSPRQIGESGQVEEITLNL